eukprot:6657570-Prymnesium_polylepis.1
MELRGASSRIVRCVQQGLAWRRGPWRAVRPGGTGSGRGSGVLAAPAAWPPGTLIDGVAFEKQVLRSGRSGVRNSPQA